MANKIHADDAVTERCDACKRETEHAVEINLRTESSDADAENAAFSREPYRVATCRACGETTTWRMNNA